MNPKVSIIVPIYNSEKYMSKCIESILNQTLNEIEIILVNDGSTDNSGEIIDEYAKKDNRIKVIHQENSGPSVARNKGISIAKGKYIGFVDSDDYIEPTMYEELYNNANNKNIEVAMCSYNEKYLYNETEYVVKAKLDCGRIYEKEDIKHNIISTFSRNDNYGFYSLCNKLYLKEWLSKENLTIDTNRDHGEDWWFNINVFSKLNSFVYIDKELYNYVHSNNNSLMVKYRENQFDLFLDGRLKMKEIMPEEYMNYEEFNKRFVYEFSSYIIRTFKEVVDKNKANQLINRVLDNEEVIECCKNVFDLPIHFKVASFFIKNRLKRLSRITYKLYKFIEVEVLNYKGRDKMEPLVSVIVPIYNVEKYLRKCIDSILNQTLENIEIILVNDGSTDNSGKIIDEYKLKDKRIKVVHKENEGQSSARNIGLDIVRGEYIGFVDSDDWIDKDFFELGYKYIKQHNGDIGVFSRRTYTEQSDLLYEIKVKQEEIYLDTFGINNYIVERLLNTHTLGGCNKLYKNKIIVENNIKFDSVKYIGSEDTLFNYKVLQHANKVVGISDTYYNCLARDGSTARSYDKEYMLRINNLLENIQNYSSSLHNKDNSKSITPIMLIHFLNRNITRISNYSNENISHSLAIQLKQAMSKDSIKENMKYILSDKNYLEYIRKIGYSTKGIIYIKIFSLLCIMKRYKLAA